MISLGQLDRLEIEKSKHPQVKNLLLLLQNKDRLLSTLLVGNNLVNVGASALATTMAINYAALMGWVEELTVTLAAVALTLLILFFGEITPKNFALKHNRAIALATTPLVRLIALVLYPASALLSWASRLMVGKHDDTHKISESTVINVVNKGEELGVINETEKSLIEKVFLFDEREVYPIMTPRTKVFALREECTLEAAQEEMLTNLYSRVPVYAESIDNITGIVNLKEVFKELLSGGAKKTLKELASKPLFVYETMGVSDLLERFRTLRTHIAIVVDEYGGLSGIITLEDLLEELVGEIFDEKDQDAQPGKKIGTGKWMVSGEMDLLTLNREIEGELNEEGDFETMQGLIMHRLKRLPKTGDRLQVREHRLTVMRMKQNRILQVMVEFLPHPTEAD